MPVLFEAILRGLYPSLYAEQDGVPELSKEFEDGANNSVQPLHQLTISPA